MATRWQRSLLCQLSRTRPRVGSTVMMVIVGIVVAAVIIGAAWYFLTPAEKSDKDAPLLSTVSRGPFDHIVQEQGEVESSNSVEIRCEVKARTGNGTAVLEVVSEGTQVAKDDVLVKLDSSGFDQDRVQQQIMCNTSEAIMIQAKNTFEAAEIAKKEYTEGTFVQEEQLILSEIFVAEDALKRAQLNLESGKRLAAKGLVNSLQLEADQFALDKARNELAAAQTKLAILRKYTREKMLKQFDSDVKTAEARWKAEQSSYALELDKLKTIDEQITRCTIRAPQAGQVVFANIVSSRGGSSEFVVEPGAIVREKQVIIRLPDPQQMQVKARINESRITLVKPGMPVAIRLDAFGDQPLRGEVMRVNQYAEPNSWFSSTVKEYATYIKVFDPPPQIRPGLTAEVRIFALQLPDALQVPVQAIYEHKGHTFSLVKKGDDWETREINIGSSNDKTVTVLSGLDENEQVVLNPRRHSDKLVLPDLPDPKSIQTIVANGQTSSGSPTPSNSDTVANSGGPVPPTVQPTRGPAAPGGNGPPDPAAIAGFMFQRYDTDGDGRLSQEEISNVPDDRRANILVADTNGDGVVDRAELTTSISQRTQSAGATPAPTGGGE
jgi:HlyD family secretion protein